MRFPTYILIRCVTVEELLGRPKVRLQFRGPRILQGERALFNGTLPEVLAYARREYGEDVAQDIVTQAVALQKRNH